MSPRARLDPDQLAALEDQRDFLLRSIEDLEAEHAAGDLGDEDYATLRNDYTVRAAEALRAIEAQRSAFDAARKPRSRKRTVTILGAVVAFAVVAGLLMANALGAREAGDTATGGISVASSPSQRAQECIELLAPQAPSEAIGCFEGVLEDDPRNAVAKTWLGWQLELTSSFLPDAEQGAQVQAQARSLVEEAVAEDPDYSYARAFRAVIAFRREEFALAQEYLEDFRARNPSPDAESVITQFDLDAQIADALAADGGGTAGASDTTGADGEGDSDGSAGVTTDTAGEGDG